MNKRSCLLACSLVCAIYAGVNGSSWDQGQFAVLVRALGNAFHETLAPHTELIVARIKDAQKSSNYYDCTNYARSAPPGMRERACRIAIQERTRAIDGIAILGSEVAQAQAITAWEALGEFINTREGQEREFSIEIVNSLIDDHGRFKKELNDIVVALNRTIANTCNKKMLGMAVECATKQAISFLENDFPEAAHARQQAMAQKIEYAIDKINEGVPARQMQVLKSLTQNDNRGGHR
ncbi:hypothetical protein ACFL6Y_11560 [Elusimicrobiota bacterium]